MKKFKKLFAVLLTLAMVLGMSMTTMAANAIPTSNDTATITVAGIEAGAEVYAYKIVKADYNNAGLLGYSKVDTTDVFDIYNPSSDDVVVLAEKYRKTEGTPLVYDASTETYKLENAEAGTYLILVKGNPSVNIYNPMVVSLGYKIDGEGISGSWNELQAGTITADSNWSFGDSDAYAKRSPVTIKKEADQETANFGDTVNYTVTTTVPDYSEEYKTVTFNVTDTLTHLTFKEGVTVTATGNASEPMYEAKFSEDKKKLTIKFDSEWVKLNGGTNLIIKYSATMDTDAVNKVAHENKVELNYTNNPGTDEGHSQDIEKVYTFDIDGTFTENILKKVKEGTTAGTREALEGAEFTLYTDEACTNQYTNTYHVAGTCTSTSDKNGQIFMQGLAEGTYYLKETRAPEGYSLNDTVYKIEICDVDIKDEELVSWNVKVTNLVTGKEVTNTSSFVVEGEKTVAETDIVNTTLSALPSTGGIGTTIFTIGGCLIMIIAAALFFSSRKKSEAK